MYHSEIKLRFSSSCGLDLNVIVQAQGTHITYTVLYYVIHTYFRAYVRTHTHTHVYIHTFSHSGMQACILISKATPVDAY